jgi:hypothetical protein
MLVDHVRTLTWDSLEINTVAPLILFQACFPLLKPGSRVVFNTSGAASRPTPEASLTFIVRRWLHWAREAPARCAMGRLRCDKGGPELRIANREPRADLLCH